MTKEESSDGSSVVKTCARNVIKFGNKRKREGVHMTLRAAVKHMCQKNKTRRKVIDVTRAMLGFTPPQSKYPYH